VAPDRLRFDFTHFAAPAPDQLARIEEIVNGKVRENLPITTARMGLEEARAGGAMALFGEKYGDVVRVVRIGGYSFELCGGTHLRATGQIGGFRLLSEGGVAAGVRRAEAVTAEGASRAANAERALLAELGRLLHAPPGELTSRVERLLGQNRDLEREIEALRRRATGSEIDQLVEGAKAVQGLRVAVGRVAPKDLEDFRRMADALREKLGSGAGVLGADLEGRATFLAVVTDDLIRSRGLKAGDLVKEVARVAGGGGGGKPHMAQAGGKDLAKLDEALAQTVEIVNRLLSK
jgi:alanyl-tRNA synthetase